MIDIAIQYRTIAAASGWLDKTSRGRLRFDGADGKAFLQALLSNEVASLPAGAGAYALYLTPQGRMIADLHVFVRPDCLIVDTPADNAAALTETFDRAIFSEDVRVTDQSHTLRQISVLGAGTAHVLARAFNLDPAAVMGLRLWSQLDAGRGFVIRTDDAREGSWDVVVRSDEAEGVVHALEAAGAVSATGELAEAMRIDAGRPRFGVDMTEDTIPLEAGLLERAISQTKGCYVGQEVIIRVLHRGGGRVAKRLARIACDDADPLSVPAVGASVSVDGRDVGRVTSSCWSPREGRPIALAYVHRDSAEPGVRLDVSSGQHAVITALAG